MSRHFSCRSFNEDQWHSYRQTLENQLVTEIHSQRKEYIIAVDESQYISHLIDKYTLSPLVVDNESETIANPTTLVQTREDYGRRFQVEAYAFNIKYRFTGSAGLFRVQPSTWTMTTAAIQVEPETSEVSFEVVIGKKSPEEFARAKKETWNNAFCNIGSINNCAAEWNNALPGIINRTFNSRKKHFLDENNFFAAINVKPSSASSGIFSVPLIEKKKIPQPQITPGTTFTAEPSFAESTYRDILKLMHSIGTSMEQKPSLYIGKEEEALRDHFLTFMETRYEGTTASGETFNRGGKTDILLKYQDGSNLFVAECKFWSGPTGLHDAITQLFDRYLTWRDSKTALILFVRNKDFTNVLATIQAEAKKSKYFTKALPKSNDSSFAFEFHLPQDTKKPVQFEIMAFHFDKASPTQ